MKRYLTKYIQEDLDKKIVLLTGPRQTGKTTLSKMLKTDYDYFNFDNPDDRVRSPVSYSSLARDIECSDKTVKRWLTILENMYVLFKVPPFHKNIARAIQKTPKFYFYDTGQVIGDSGNKGAEKRKNISEWC